METPPITPVRSTRPPAMSAPSTQMASPSQHMCDNSADEHSIQDGLLLYPYARQDYELGRQVGEGQFSTVYEAIVKDTKAPASTTTSDARKRNDSALSPPATPIRASVGVPSRVLAIKRPLDRSSAKVCRDEARILTRLSCIDGHGKYVVPFHGLDTRSNAIIMDLMPYSLEAFIKGQLNVLSLEQRTDVVAASWHHTVSYLLHGLEWLHSHGFVHGDIKPGNILLRPSEYSLLPSAMRFDPIYSDFSSAAALEEDPASPRESPVAGGTWDFMYFGHIKDSPESPEILNDRYGLTMTILYFIVGDSAYRSISNAWLQMDARKQGRPVDFIMRDPELAQRFEAVQARPDLTYLTSGFERAFNGQWEAVLG